MSFWESIIAILFLDGGFEIVNKVIGKIIGPFF